MRITRHAAVLLFILLFSGSQAAHAQGDTSSTFHNILSFPDKLFGVIDKKSRDLETRLDKQTEKYINRIIRREAKLKKNLWKRDSVLAKELFADIDSKYESLKKAPGQVNAYSGVYSGHLDSLSTALTFLKNDPLASYAGSLQLEKSLHNLQDLQAKLNHTDGVKKYLQQRQQLLKQQFQKLGMVKELKKYQKQVYYYQAQVREYQQAFEDPTKLEAKLMEVLVKVPAFKDFFARNSQLGSLFALPSSGSGASAASLQGLQTRASVQQALQDRFGSGPQVTQALQQNVQEAQSKLSALKSKVSHYSSGSFGNSSGDVDLPEGFKPNGQKTKSFLSRLEYGGNMQSQKARNYFPVTSDIGVSLGYKLNDKSVVGVGAAYKMGWGSGFNNIKITHQGVGLRSYVDWKLKGSFYMSGGYELNYQSLIHSIEQLKDQSAWQRSGLVGVSKRYSVSKKLKGDMKLLWDFLSYQQVPRAQPVVFRVGYNLK